VREQRQITPPRLEIVLPPCLPPECLENTPLDEVVARAGGAELRPSSILETLEKRRGLPRGVVENLVLRTTPFLELRASPEVGAAKEHVGQSIPPLVEHVRRDIKYRK